MPLGPGRWGPDKGALSQLPSPNAAHGKFRVLNTLPNAPIPTICWQKHTTAITAPLQEKR
jgi:hypothetical protein